MSMIAFYTDSDVQALRLCRNSALGKREKAVKNDRYLLNETLLAIRARQLPMVEIPSLDELKESMRPKVPGPREETHDDRTSLTQNSSAPDPISIPFTFTVEIGRASCRERVGPYV